MRQKLCQAQGDILMIPCWYKITNSKILEAEKSHKWSKQEWKSQDEKLSDKLIRKH